MNRRDVIQLAGLAALSMGAGEAFKPESDDDWITVCHKGTNSNGNVYGEPEIIQVFTDVQPGMQIREWCFDPGDENTLEGLRGLVSESRRTADSVQVRVRWLKEKPVGSFVTIHGMAQMKDGRFEWLTVHHLDVTSAGSSFELATAV